MLCAYEERKSESKNMITENVPKTKDGKQRARAQWKKGYDLPLEEEEQAEAADVVLQDETILEMQNAVAETGCPVSVTVAYSDMGNYEKAEQFLVACEKGKSGSVAIYDVCQDGGINRRKFIYDGTDMYVISTSGVWVENDKSGIAYMNY